MLRRLVLKVIRSMATTVFTALEVLGIPRVRDEGGPAPGRDPGPGGGAEG